MKFRLEKIPSKDPRYNKKYYLKIVSRLQLDSLVDLFGIDGALSVIERFGGTRFYVPSKRGVKESLRLAAMRTEAAYLKAKGVPSMEILRKLGKKYGLKGINVDRQFYNIEKSPLKIEEQKIRDKRLMLLIRKYGDKLEKLGFI